MSAALSDADIRDVVMKYLRDTRATNTEWRAWTYDHGPYEVTSLQQSTLQLCRAVEAEVLRKVEPRAPEPVGVIGIIPKKPWIVATQTHGVIEYHTGDDGKATAPIMFKSLPVDTLLFAAPVAGNAAQPRTGVHPVVHETLQREADRLINERDLAHRALRLAVQALRAPLDAWKGELEAQALGLANAVLSQEPKEKHGQELRTGKVHQGPAQDARNDAGTTGRLVRDGAVQHYEHRAGQPDLDRADCQWLR